MIPVATFFCWTITVSFDERRQIKTFILLVTAYIHALHFPLNIIVFLELLVSPDVIYFSSKHYDPLSLLNTLYLNLNVNLLTT